MKKHKHRNPLPKVPPKHRWWAKENAPECVVCQNNIYMVCLDMEEKFWACLECDFMQDTEGNVVGVVGRWDNQGAIVDLNANYLAHNERTLRIKTANLTRPRAASGLLLPLPGQLFHVVTQGTSALGAYSLEPSL